MAKKAVKKTVKKTVKRAVTAADYARAAKAATKKAVDLKTDDLDELTKLMLRAVGLTEETASGKCMDARLTFVVLVGRDDPERKGVLHANVTISGNTIDALKLVKAAERQVGDRLSGALAAKVMGDLLAGKGGPLGEVLAMLHQAGRV